MSKTQTITAAIDGIPVTVPLGTTILKAARQAGIYIPTLCYLESLPDYGGCRLCIVEVENMRGLPTACTTPLADGMKVSTGTDELQALRRDILELILSEHPYTCLVCKDKNECAEFMHSTRKVSTTTGCNFCSNNGRCELQDLVDYLQLKEIRFPIIYRNLPPVTDNPFYAIDYNLCVLCGRCVRVCNEERFSEVLAFINRGNSALVGTAFNETQKEAGCEYCGACVDVCPTGSLSEKMNSWVGVPDTSTSTNCIFCSIACDITVNTHRNTIATVGPEPMKREAPQQLCIRGKFIPGNITHHPERITRPHIKKSGKWREVSWQEAISCISDNLKKYHGNQFGMLGSAHDTIENAFVLQDFARRIMQSANIDIYPSTGYSTLIKDIHTHYSSVGHTSIEDILSADTIYVIGAQTNWSHPIIENRIRKAYKAEKEVIVASSCTSRTINFSTSLQNYKKGCEHIYIYNLRKQLAEEKKVEKIVILVGDEILHSDLAMQNVSNLMRIATFPGKKIKMLFLLPEGNRYGVTMAGMNPVLLPGFSLSADRGLTAEEMLKKRKAITALYLIGDIPPVSPLKGLQFFVQQNMFFTPASDHAHVFLPLIPTLESSGSIINIEGRHIQIQPVIRKDVSILSTYEIINSIAAEMDKEALDIPTESIYQNIVSRLRDQTIARQVTKVEDLSPPDPKSRSKNSKLTRESLKKYHFHYMGNSLTDIIPDLQEALEE